MLSTKREILHQDDNAIVVVKRRGEDSEALPQIIENELGLKSKSLNAIYRLDKPIEGVFLLSKKNRIKPDDIIEKRYIARVAGCLEKTDDEQFLEDILFHDKRKNKSFVVKKERNGTKTAKLSYVVLDNSFEDNTTVKIKLYTGRTHQIRVQFASRKHPLIGDGKYGSRQKGDINLVCSYLKYKDSISGKEYEFSIEPWFLVG